MTDKAVASAMARRWPRKDWPIQDSLMETVMSECEKKLTPGLDSRHFFLLSSLQLGCNQG
jgi:hypothetical protein